MARRVNVDEAALEAAYKNGEGLAALQKKFGVNRMTARKILISRGVTIRTPGRPRTKNPTVRTTTNTTAVETPARSFNIIGND